MSALTQLLRALAVTLGVLMAIVVVGLVVAGGPEMAQAQVWAKPPSNLNTVINNITRWVVGIVASLATLCLTIGGLRYLLAGGDPGEVAKAKDTLKYAAIGYGVAILAPVLVQILKGFVGG